MKTITIEAVINSNIDNIWKCWTTPEHITEWNQASTDWHCPKAVNNFTVGGRFLYTMSAKDKSTHFVFEGIYTKIKVNNVIEYNIVDGRKVTVTFKNVEDNSTKIIESFEIESTNSEDQQRTGWSDILNNFKSYCER